MENTKKPLQKIVKSSGIPLFRGFSPQGLGVEEDDLAHAIQNAKLYLYKVPQDLASQALG